MNLEFCISEELLFIVGLMQQPNIDNWVGLQDKLWKKYESGYRLLQGNYFEFFLNPKYKGKLDQAITDIECILSEGMNSTEFSKLLINAQEHKVWLERKWEQNKVLINEELNNILRTDLPEETVTVYVLSQLLHVGRNIRGRILWGQYEHWPNYSLVYLVHEYLHSLFKYTKIEHAIIELISDNEMRIRLNKEGKYFECAGEKVGHKHLLPVRKVILDDWKEYLGNRKTNIYQFIENLKQKYPQYYKEENE
ncbi:MAG: hypothetical protein ABIA11_00260 [Patescibacteria group bacterium]